MHIILLFDIILNLVTSWLVFIGKPWLKFGIRVFLRQMGTLPGVEIRRVYGVDAPPPQLPKGVRTEATSPRDP